MAGTKLKRIEALERRARPYTPGAWIEGHNGDTTQDAMARYERDVGPLDPHAMHIVWLPAVVEQRHA